MSGGEGANSNLSLLFPDPGSFERGVPYRIRVTAVSPGGLYPAPSVWSFREELGKRWGWRMEGPGTTSHLDPLTFSPAPSAGPALWRLQDDPPGTPTIEWGDVPRRQLRGHLTHYTVCAQSGTRPSVCMNGELSCLLLPAPSSHKTHPSAYLTPCPQMGSFGSHSDPGKTSDVISSLVDSNPAGCQCNRPSFDH